MATSHWLPVQRIEDSHARNRVRDLIDWESADEDLLREFASASASVKATPLDHRPTCISISAVEPSKEDALFVCRYSGDIAGLRSTLITLGLTADDLTVQLVCRGRPTTSEILALRALCQGVRFAVSLVVLDGAAPFSNALTLGYAEVPERTIILADSGIVPLDRDWWQRLRGVLAQDPTVLCYALPEPQPTIVASALSYLSETCPLLAAGPRLAAEIIYPDFELQTFEGVLHHALTMAGPAGSAERLGWLRLMATSEAGTADSFGAARLDDAVIAAALEARAPGLGAKGNNLVHLAPRAGAG